MTTEKEQVIHEELLSLANDYQDLDDLKANFEKYECESYQHALEQAYENIRYFARQTLAKFEAQ